eukprot:286237-Karenia_brevis.AAC.1
MKYEGGVVDERGIKRWADLCVEKVETTEKEEKSRIMRCMIKAIFDGIEKTHGKDAAIQEIAIKNWKDPWIIASNKGAIQAVCTFQMTDRA